MSRSNTVFVPVEAKLRAPSVTDALVLRGTIVDRLLESVDTPLVLVTAPAGSGKTIVVTQWDREDVRPFAWVTLDPGDNDAVVLARYVVLALQRVEPVDPSNLSLLRDDIRIAGVDLAQLGRFVASEPAPFVLVLDGAEALTSRPSLAVVSTIVDHLPAGSQVAILARRPPTLDWNRLRAKRRLVDIDANQLRFSMVEARALMADAGLHLEPDEVQTLVDKTEGWAAGLYLASMSLSASAVQRRSIDTFFGGEARVASYLREELLAPLDPDDQTFLIRASILDQLSGPLLDATLGTQDSDARLQRLAATNSMLLVRTDREGRWFRLHRLFADALSSELNRQEPQLVAQLHSAASKWLEDYGDAAQAIKHAIAAHQISRAARLIWSEVPFLLATGRTSAVENWLESFTSREVAGHARLALTAAWCAIQRGHSVDHWVAAASRGLYEAERKGEADSVTGAIALLRAQLARNGAMQMGADAQLAGRLLPPDDLWLCHAGLLEAASLLLTDSVDEALVRLQSVEHMAETLGLDLPRAQAMAQRALVLIMRNGWPTARALVDEAAALIRDADLGNSPPAMPVLALVALISAQSGDHQEALTVGRHVLSTIAVAADLAAWSGAQCRYVLARTQLILGDAAAARMLLSEATSLLGDVPDASWLHEAVNQTWRQTEKLPLGLGAGASALTTAELRVLQYLPTHLSFEQIGRELFVSRNTVKTQAIAAYRKLGVSSRSEAVERAQMLGLVNPPTQ